MEYDVCPVCAAHALELSARNVPGGLVVHGRCLACGYACDSDYDTAEVTDDFRFEYDLPLETGALD
jgi:hypothetical protein